MNLRLMGLLAGGVLLLSILAAAGIMRAQLTSLQGKVARHDACLASVKGAPVKGQPPKPSSETCEPAIAQADQLADQAMACEAALAANKTTTSGRTATASQGAAITAHCLTGTQRLFLQGLADLRTILNLRGELDAADDRQSQAVTRAELRGRQSAERENRARAVRESAPRDGDGLRVYDAGRLRERFETYP